MKIFEKIPQEIPKSRLLQDINLPEDLRHLEKKDLPELADELREFLLYTTGKSGGHFGAGLGVIELTIGLHYVFETPKDKLVWDVGHQTYPHKILTGRKDSMESIRKMNGLAPFPNRSESEFDSFGVGHSSTSISSALGMITASNLKKDEKKVVAIIGDGSMTAGMAYEALCHAGALNKDILVILNDNQMSISESVGGLSKYLSRIWASKFYNQLREGGKTVLRFIPSAKRFIKKAELHTKGMVSPGTLFEELGFEYIGPIDGHNISELVKILGDIRKLKGPIFLHTVTTKGKGFKAAEEDPIGYHAIEKIKPLSENINSNKPRNPKYSEVFGEWLCKTAEKEPKLIAITPAMREGSGMVDFEKRFSDRFFDTAIAEQHCVTLAAGMACENMKPVVGIYSTFLQRAYDQLIHDVAIQNLDVTFAIDRAGLVGADGPTHVGAFDLTYLRCIPNIIIMTPSNEEETWRMLNTGFHFQGPAAIRYPRGSGPGSTINRDSSILEIGKANVIRRSKNSTFSIFSFGSCITQAQSIGETFDATVVDMRFVKPLDEELIINVSKKSKLILTIEENVIAGGAGSAVAELLNLKNINTPIMHAGLPDEFIDHGDVDQQKIKYGLNTETITKNLKERLELI
ncbi:MAG: 1-deoxy-D-xylulose-5-phosphate synthase [SAR86 cluster bacterium]|nr:1-deoxy-D-xylulose-5-phosphate synthase [SAR86 cluster bacterium]